MNDERGEWLRRHVQREDQIRMALAVIAIIPMLVFLLLALLGIADG